jgi:NitT/TauT family transport system permease protein
MSTTAPPAGARTRVGAAVSQRARIRVLRWGTVAALVVVWEVICRGPLASSGYVTGPVTVLRHGVPKVLASEPLSALGHTTWRFLAAFAVTAVLGTVVGLALGRLHRQLFLGSRDVVTVLYALPLAPFYPLFVLWLGLGDKSEIAFGVIHGVVPVILLTMSASADVSPSLLDSSRAMGAGRVQRLLTVVLPAVVPELMSALKIGAALTLLGILLAELMISVGGVGSFVAAQITNQQAAGLDAMVLLVCLGALVVNAALSAAERRVSGWRPTAPEADAQLTFLEPRTAHQRQVRRTKTV